MLKPSEELLATLVAAGALPVGELDNGARWFVPHHGPVPLVLDLIGDQSCAVPMAINTVLARAAKSKLALPPKVGRLPDDTLIQRCDVLLAAESSQHTDTAIEWLPNSEVAEYWCAHLKYDWFEPAENAGPKTYHA